MNLRWIVAAVTVAALGVVTGRAGAQPVINFVTPTSGPTGGGTQIQLFGSGLTGTAPTQVTIGGRSASVVTATKTSLIVTLPAGEGAGLPIVVMVDGISTTAGILFSYTAPMIALMNPSSGPASGGTIVTIQGSNFGLTSMVTFGGTPAAVIMQSHTALTVVAPAGAQGPALVRVTAGGQVSNALAYGYLDPPIITSLMPSTGPTEGGSVAVVSGSGFDPGAVVSIGGSNAPVVMNTPMQLTITIPAGQGVGHLLQVISGGELTSLPGAFAYLPPHIAGIIEGGLGDPVEIVGMNFGLTPIVTFGASSAAVMSGDHGSLVVLPPAAPPGSTVDVRVTVAGQVSNMVPYTYPPAGDCAADLNGDGRVDSGDLAILLGSWGICVM